ncbi:hypothetical protein CKM354_000803900 [Cercospora kikuchii]|uniref:Alpha-1,2-mannosyltransferase n=1 Tax=Cercospora kikuchii TaxID=84275 RepID=A0A9P3FEW4_9PEZI|nr:uncharacterized protein CKM354_000803900 [Cercospora kikuchii]GIZ44853.1 hypothetical protein CKM354_000803900 [Cercospora kikuchii]
MPSFAIWALLAVLTGYVLYFAINAPARQRLADRLGLQRRRCSVATTPPRDLPPKPIAEVDANALYVQAFPPHRRNTLAELRSSADSQLSRPLHTLAQLPADHARLLPDKASPDLLLHALHTTPTGFTLTEIEELGEFPDYATLSGVPLPKANDEFDIATALSRPYRPFRWAYHQTMSITKMEPDWWLELNQEYADTIRWRVQTFEEQRDTVLQTLPGSEVATRELMEMCLQFLCARYPHYFHLDRENMIFHNHILKTQTDLASTPPMLVLLHNVPEDFAIMLRDPETGLYTFRSGMIMSSLGWSLGTKIGLKLSDIHKPVPDYKEKMEFSMDRYFSKKPTDKPIQRGSWGLEVDRPLFMPPGDPHSIVREAQNSDHSIDRMHLRVDWQTLRRLPLSGAIVFNFKGLFTPVTEFRDEPYIPSLVLKVLKEGKQSIMEYKDTWHTEHVVIPYLEQCEKEQLEKGMIAADWKPETLDESPFFPGWEEKWHRQQGF